MIQVEGYFTLTDIPLDLGPCKDNFDFENIGPVIRDFNAEAICIKDKSATVFKGSMESENAQILQIRVKKCSGKPYCGSDREIRKYLASS